MFLAIRKRQKFLIIETPFLKRERDFVPEVSSRSSNDSKHEEVKK
jgi:hypothetical protein